MILYFSTLFVIQGQSLYEDLFLLKHMMKNNLFEEARHLSNRTVNSYLANDSILKELRLVSILSSLKLEQDDSCLVYLNKLKSIDLDDNLILLNAYLSINQSSDTSIDLLNHFVPKNGLMEEYKHLFLASNYLLKNDSSSFKKQIVQFNYNEVSIRPFLYNVIDYEREYYIKKRSPFIAGTLSAIIPGLGKVYGNKPKQGIMNFLLVGTLGAQAYEAYRIGGIRDGRFIFFATIGTIFYIGNIWGSALTIHVNQFEQHEQLKHQLMADLRISINKLFNKY